MNCFIDSFTLLSSCKKREKPIFPTRKCDKKGKRGQQAATSTSTLKLFELMQNLWKKNVLQKLWKAGGCCIVNFKQLFSLFPCFLFSFTDGFSFSHFTCAERHLHVAIYIKQLILSALSLPYNNQFVYTSKYQELLSFIAFLCNFICILERFGMIFNGFIHFQGIIG